jgi:hypothetical protein
MQHWHDEPGLQAASAVKRTLSVRARYDPKQRPETSGSCSGHHTAVGMCIQKDSAAPIDDVQDLQG